MLANNRIVWEMNLYLDMFVNSKNVSNGISKNCPEVYISHRVLRIYLQAVLPLALMSPLVHLLTFPERKLIQDKNRITIFTLFGVDSCVNIY